MRVVRKRENKDFGLRHERYRLEPILVVFRSIIQNQNLSSEFRIFCRFSIFKLSSASRFPGNFRNRCLLTGRVRSTLPYFKLSRIEFRRLAKLNALSGVKKSSWLICIIFSDCKINFKYKMIYPKVLSALRNAGLAKKIFAQVPMSKASLKFLDLLYFEGFIEGYSINPSTHLAKVYISYLSNELPIVSSLKGISRSGLRKSISYNNLVKCYSGKFVILNTSRGLITGTSALQYKIGGEIICSRYYF